LVLLEKEHTSPKRIAFLPREVNDHP